MRRLGVEIRRTQLSNSSGSFHRSLVEFASPGTLSIERHSEAR